MNSIHNPRSRHCLSVVLCSEADQEVLVEQYFVLDGEEHPCAAPFSWLVTLHLESLWEETEFIPGLSRLKIILIVMKILVMGKIKTNTC